MVEEGPETNSSWCFVKENSEEDYET
jgi:hypothetical protein